VLWIGAQAVMTRWWSVAGVHVFVCRAGRRFHGCSGRSR
jgi:hypothetical protein